MPIVRLVFACALHIAVACASRDGDVPAPASAPYGVDVAPALRGAPDRGRDPAVVALVGAGRLPCAGALVAPDIVLTARTCMALEQGAECAPALAPPASFDVWTGEDLDHASLVGHGRVVLAPEAAGCDADLAFVLLDRDVPGIHTLSFRQHGPAPGEHVRTVGYAARDDATMGKTLRDHVAVGEVRNAAFDAVEVPCLGRGHVALDQDTGEVIGIAAASSSCADTDPATYVRTDAFFALVQAALARSGEGEALRKLQARDAGIDAAVSPRKLPKSERPDKDLGAPCASGVDCAAGSCARVRAGRYCGRGCATTDRCPTGWRCVGAADESASVEKDAGAAPKRTTCVRSAD